MFNTVAVSDGDTHCSSENYLSKQDIYGFMSNLKLQIKSLKLALGNPATTLCHSYNSVFNASVMWEFLLLPPRLASLGGSLASHILVRCCCLHSQVEDMSVSYPIDQRHPSFFSEHPPNQSVHP